MNKFNQLTVLEEVKHNNRLMWIKNNYSLEELLYWSRLLLAKHGNPDPSVVNANKVTTKEQRLDGEEATNNPSTSAQPLFKFGMPTFRM